MNKLLIAGGLTFLGYQIFGNKIRQALKLLDVNTFNITGVKNLKFNFPNINFDIRAEYVNNTDITIPIENIVVKLYNFEDPNQPQELANSTPNSGVALKPKQTTRFSIPMAVNLGSNGLTLLSLRKNPKLMVKAWITVNGQTFIDESEFTLV